MACVIYIVIYKMECEMENTRDELLKFGIYQLRTIGREVGVKLPTTYNKNDLINEILSVTSGEKEPYFKQTKKGRPPKEIKQEIFDKSNQKLSDYLRVSREELFYLNDNSRDYESKEEIDINGLLLTCDDYKVIVPCKWSGNFCFVTENSVSVYNLREGDYIVGKAKIKLSCNRCVLTQVISVNGQSFVDESKQDIDNTLSVIESPLLSDAENVFIKSICPMEPRDRVLAVAENKKSLFIGMYSLVKNLVANPNNKVVCILTNCNFEEINVFGAIEVLTLIASAFDVEDSCQLGQYELALKHINRLCEESDKNIIEVIVDLGAIIGVYNHTQEANQTFYKLKTNFSSAKKLKNSLTIIYGLVYNTSGYSELDGLENLKITFPNDEYSRDFKFKIDILHTERSGFFEVKDLLRTKIDSFVKSGEYEERHLELERLVESCSVGQDLIERLKM